MSTDYDFGITVGFDFHVDDVLKIFGKKEAGKFHYEDRFDPKTGKKLSPEKVQDEPESICYKYKDLKYNESCDDPCGESIVFIESLAVKCGFYANVYGNWQGGENRVIFYPKKHPASFGGEDWGRVYFETGLGFEEVAKLGPELKKIEKALRKLGLKPGKPQVRLTANIH